MDTAVSVELFVEILNRYVYYFDQQNETVCTTPRSRQMLLSGVLHADLASGDNEISERSDRAYTLELTDKPRERELGSSEEAFPADAGLHIK